MLLIVTEQKMDFREEVLAPMSPSDRQLLRGLVDAKRQAEAAALRDELLGDVTQSRLTKYVREDHRETAIRILYAIVRYYAFPSIVRVLLSYSKCVRGTRSEPAGLWIFMTPDQVTKFSSGTNVDMRKQYLLGTSSTFPVSGHDFFAMSEVNQILVRLEIGSAKNAWVLSTTQRLYDATTYVEPVSINALGHKLGRALGRKMVLETAAMAAAVVGESGQFSAIDAIKLVAGLNDADATALWYSIMQSCPVCHRYGPTLLKCGRCQRVYYCGVECQREHWLGGGHRAVCVQGGE